MFLFFQRRIRNQSGQSAYHDAFLAMVLLVSLLAPVSASAAPKSLLWEYWTTQDADSKISIDHSKWNLFLSKYVYPRDDGINRLAYKNVMFTDREMLDQYITSLTGNTVTALNRDEQQVLWINLYNALTVQVILDAYPVDSIRDIDISPGFFSNGPWDKPLIEIEGLPVSLNDIEHRILRPIWRDPRVHYALNCAALGCPNLGFDAFTVENIEKYLDYSARAFINHSRGVEIKSGKLTVSSIYNWFMEDFGDSEDGILNHLDRFADTRLKEAIAAGISIGGYRYDWTLNDTTASIADRLRKRGS